MKKKLLVLAILLAFCVSGVSALEKEAVDTLNANIGKNIRSMGFKNIDTNWYTSGGAIVTLLEVHDTYIVVKSTYGKENATVIIDVKEIAYISF